MVGGNLPHTFVPVSHRSGVTQRRTSGKLGPTSAIIVSPRVSATVRESYVAGPDFALHARPSGPRLHAAGPNGSSWLIN